MRSRRLTPSVLLAGCLFSLCIPFACSKSALEPESAIPLPEHPRPDWQRADWINLNGNWKFGFDPSNVGVREEWFRKDKEVFPGEILVPFPWGSPLSGVDNESDIAWYSREIQVPDSWKGSRVYLVIGACDWETEAWLNGRHLGIHRGGYTPFEFELTSFLEDSGPQHLVLRVDDAPRPFKLEGKQGYGPARGIWQTVYLEARGDLPLGWVHFLPDIEKDQAEVKVGLLEPAPAGARISLRLLDSTAERKEVSIAAGVSLLAFELPIESPRLWTLEDPFLYEVELSVTVPGAATDRVKTYFGMRKIGVVQLEGSGYSYIALNNQPVYLQMTLDQAYHPEGYYTFPSDDFVRDEILRSLKIGLNGMRVHVKTAIPRKLFWADRLGMLIMADVPNSWGEPTVDMQAESQKALTGMIRRDFNHPSVFSWVIFNETWGLLTDRNRYLPETKQWVQSMFELAKTMDPTRLVEDNSPNRQDHVVTDINSWHAYLPGYEWEERLQEITDRTFQGSTWNFAEGYHQDIQPLLNSECGNVWGYEGSTGDVDWSWDYHLMLNAFRKHPKLCGWLYTEHHDVINEWNGYYRYDRSEKFTGLEELVPGMSLNDLHSKVYISPGQELVREVQPGSTVGVPLWLSVHDLVAGESELTLHAQLYGWDDLGVRGDYWQSRTVVEAKPWSSRALPALEVPMPAHRSLAILALRLEDEAGSVLHRNFTAFLTGSGEAPRYERREVRGKKVMLLRFAPDSYSSSSWSQKEWQVLEGLKVNGAGSGFFEYHVNWPSGLSAQSVQEGILVLELSAKQLFGKDREGAAALSGDYMRGEGAHDPGLNPNSYPMTDNILFPSLVRVRVNGEVVSRHYLPDDPADHRGILSWHSQLRDGRLREAGSFGYLVKAQFPEEVLQKAAREGVLTLRLEVDPSLAGGLAVYGARFGRYLFDPTVQLILNP